jgi:hypothetical protein
LHRDRLSWLVDPVVVLRLRRGQNPDSVNTPETDDTVDSVKARITNEFMEEEGRIVNLGDTWDTARRLVNIIDDHTPLL